MPNNKAFVYEVKPVGTFDPNEHNLIHQCSPAWVLTFVRWANRDTFRVKNVPSTEIRNLPLVVENDCIQLSTADNKSTLTPSMSATLVMTDVNYETAVAPGDFVMVNILNWPQDARRVANNARAKLPINGIADGFKGIYKIQSVRKVLDTDPNDGIRTIRFQITGFAFTEFNNTIYFNPYLLDPNQDPQNQLLFTSYIGKDWANLIDKKGLTDIQDIIAVLIQSFIGTGINTSTGSAALNHSIAETLNVNTHFYMPSLIGSLLGIKGVQAAKDIYTYIFGIQNYAGGIGQSVSAGMNPQGMTPKYGKFWYTPRSCDGQSYLKPEYWNQVKAWSILNQYTNSPLNEIYTCFRVHPKNESIVPTLVFRQIPFTNEDFSQSQLPVTKFMSVPRWKIDSGLILGIDLGREEAARINFVQYFATALINANGTEISGEISHRNYDYDIADVQRSGLRPYIITTQFGDLSDKNPGYKSPDWAHIVADFVIGGHLKMNGTITTAGIVDPIPVGDNLEFDGVVYHIEQVSHSCSFLDGKSIFRTQLSLSNGISTSSSIKGTRYDEMTYTDANRLRQEDAKYNEILPGVSESQSTVYRTVNPDVNDSGKTPDNVPYVQPNTQKGSQKGGK